MHTKAIKTALRRLANPYVAAGAARYFKSGPGEYGAGDKFLGVRAPDLHDLARTWQDIPIDDVTRLLHSSWHEERALALLILVRQFQRNTEQDRRTMVRFYLANTDYINNWDLVDSSAPKILGAWLAGRDRRVLYRLARSRILWERRIAIIATFHLIRLGEHADTLALAEVLLGDGEDLIHKAVGWMLREVGRRDGKALRGFLRKYHRRMPRTMLRYAIEKFPQRERRAYLYMKE